MLGKKNRPEVTFILIKKTAGLRHRLREARRLIIVPVTALSNKGPCQISKEIGRNISDSFQQFISLPAQTCRVFRNFD